MNNTTQAAAYLKTQHDRGSTIWQGKCLMLQRIARGLPAMYPSAISAALATPVGERVTKLQDLKRGMVAYSDDPNDGNPYGHIYFILGRDNLGRLLTWSNDVKRSGGVDIVPIEYYRTNWGDSFQFGATWLNGYNFAEFDKAPIATRGTLGQNYRHAIKDIEKAIETQHEQGHDHLVKVLKKDLTKMEKRLHLYT